jgi:hypothetical protein
LDSVDLVKLIKKISNRWYIHSVLMIIGGLCGLFYSQLNPPVYESNAVFSVIIDYTQTGALTDIQEDQALAGVGSILLSDQVIAHTVEQLFNETKLEMNQSDFINHSFIDREEFQWTLRYRDPDQNKAEKVIKTWAKTADSIIQEALTHSQASSALLDNLNEMKVCIQKATSDIGQSSCGDSNLESLMNSISEISVQIQNEKVNSLGLFNAMSVSLVNEGNVNPSVVLGQRNLLVFSGIVIGLIVSIVAVTAMIMKRSSSI